jgi:anaerobic ribonucleoside-triphosphate reductase activating protein
MLIELAARVPCTAAEGPHLRWAAWVQGCTLGCAGCCNPEMFARGRGEVVAVERLLAEIDDARGRHGIEGITVLGGEPLEQIEPVAALARGAAARGLGVIVFSGLTIDEARARERFARLWPAIDTLVDGRFDARSPEHERRFVGSRNQTLVHRTPRYADPALWLGAREVEVHVDARGGLTVLGDPASARRLVRELARDP